MSPAAQDSTGGRVCQGMNLMSQSLKIISFIRQHQKSHPRVMGLWTPWVIVHYGGRAQCRCAGWFYWPPWERAPPALPCVCVSCSVLSDSLWPHGLKPTRLPVGFSRWKYGSGLPFPSPGNLPDLGIEPQVSYILGGFFTIWTSREAPSYPLDRSKGILLITQFLGSNLKSF